jgi:hypothetical protein
LRLSKRKKESEEREDIEGQERKGREGHEGKVTLKGDYEGFYTEFTVSEPIP